MFVYYLKRRSGDLAMADLRKVEAYEGAEDEIVFLMSSPIKERDYDLASERILKGINKKILLRIQERHGIALSLIPIFASLLIYFGLIMPKIDISIANQALLFMFILIACVLLTIRLFRNQKVVKSTRESYAAQLQYPSIVYTDEMKKLEMYYEELYEYDLKTMAAMLAEGRIKGYEGDVSIGFLLALECYIIDCDKMVHRYARILNTPGYNQEREREHIQNDTATGLLDIYFLAFFLGVNKKDQ